MGPDIIEAWVNDVAQSQSRASCLESVNIDTNIPQKTDRKQGDSKGGNTKGRGNITAIESPDGTVSAESEKRGDDGLSEDHVSVLGPHAVPRFNGFMSTDHDVLYYNDAALARLSHESISISSRSGLSTRSTSPVKRAQDLRKPQRHVRFTRQSPRDLAATMASASKGSYDLFKRIRTKIKSRRGILPLQLKDVLLFELGYERGDQGNDGDEDIGYMFSNRTPTTTPPAAVSAASDNREELKAQRRRQLFAEAYDRAESQEDPAATAEKYVPINETLYKLDLLLELETLLDIVARTNDFVAVSRSEPAWNEAIHRPILELSLRSQPQVKVENITRANIAKPFQPSLRPRLELDLPSVTELVDYALLLEPVPNGHLSNCINDFVATLQLETFNQSSYQPLRTLPSGVFVKTKVDGKGYQEAQAQVGVWMAAWFERVGEFRNISDLAIPLVIAAGEEWELWFAIDRPDCFDVCGPLAIGGTGDLQSIYLLRYCLACLGDWMTEDFRRWVELCVGAA
ncbi:hypothetical protein F5Y10DRAFT_261321 [Nemania abortiva]|nr:hypothetical protein F5Y10DRAFT_261321 [Nemania abortiva]